MNGHGTTGRSSDFTRHPRLPRTEPTSLTQRRLSDLPDGEERASAIESGEGEWFWYARGYLESADVLSRAIEKDPHRMRWLAAPMMFLYRHHIELHLKSLLRECGELLDEPQSVPGKHYLGQLWLRVRGYLLRVSPQSDGPWLSRADQIIAEFESFDPESFAWRYPVNRQGAATLPAGFRVDAALVRGIFAELSMILEGASAQIELLHGLKREMNLP